MSEEAAAIETEPLVRSSGETSDGGAAAHGHSLESDVSFPEAVLNTLKCSLGAGILGFPYAFRKSGWLGGLIACFTVSLATGFGMHMCIQVGLEMRAVAAKHKEYSKRKYLEYTDIAQLAGGVWARRSAWWAIVVGQLGVCIAYVIFITNNLTGSLYSVSVPRWVIVLSVYPFVLSLSFVKNLKSLLWAAMMGLVLLFVGIIFVLNYGFNNPTFPNDMPPLEMGGMIVTVGIATFAMESITVIPALMASMREPEHFPSVLNIAIVSVLVLYALFGIFGALSFGVSTKSVITKDIPVNSVNGTGSRIALVLYILCTFPFQMFPLAQTIDRSISNLTSKVESSTSFYMVRFLLVTFTTVCGIFLKDFGTFMALIGYPCLGVLGLVLPGYMACENLKLSPLLYGLCCYGLLWGGLCFSILGTIGSVIELIEGEI